MVRDKILTHYELGGYLMNINEALSRRTPITNTIIPTSLLTARSLLWVATLLTFLFPFNSWAQTPASSTAQAPKNIVILMADDLGWGDVGFHGGIASTPNLDQLAKESVELTRFYAYPACSPARAALLTGRFPQRFGIVGPVRSREQGLPTDEVLLPASFQTAGYQTSLIGKWHLGHSKHKSHPNQRGLDHFYGFMNASIDYYQHTSRNRLDWQRNGTPVNETGYATDLLTNEAIKQIETRDKSKPFCMVVAYNAPHSPFQGPKELIAKYPQLSHRAANYAAMVESLDIGIGRILKTIDQQNLANETVVVFTSDNGAPRIGNNQPFRGQKRQVYEGGIHVPCLVRLPNALPAGTKNAQLSKLDDLFPTLASATNVKLTNKKTLDGKDIWPQLQSATSTPRTIVIAENDFALISDEWKLISNQSGSHELFNLKSDNAESKNVFAQQPTIGKRLLAGLNSFKQNITADKPVSFAALNPTQASPQSSDKPIAPTGEGSNLATVKLTGDAKFGTLGDRRVESSGSGIRLLSAVDLNSDKQHAATATMISKDVDPKSRWYRFYISGFAQDNFTVDRDDLYLKVEFLKDNGTESLDLIKERIYPQVLRERSDLKDAGTNKNLGNGTWRTYSMDFRTPFAEIDSLALSVGFANGTGQGETRTEFWVREMNVKPINAPENYQPIPDRIATFPQPNIDSLVHLGGRWYYDPQGGDKTVPKKFDHTNDDQLLYKSDKFEPVFADNMTSWLRAGYKDRNNELVTEDQYRPDNLVIQVTHDHIILYSRNLPNHPTATFPDRWRMLDGNPSFIQEQSAVWKLPINPKVKPDRVAMNAQNENKALPMGPIGVATNGVIFFIPFDHINETDATWRLDRCCGHPSPRSQYHYHKYPVCVKTPWSDEGRTHSNVIGFGFDGFPVYGPYEADGLLARDDTKNPLNDFNLHTDDQRGPHYHVTPGKFPHIIGGYWGEVPPRQRRR